MALRPFRACRREVTQDDNQPDHIMIISLNDQLGIGAPAHFLYAKHEASIAINYTSESLSCV
jgi:hypothetical protein